MPFNWSTETVLNDLSRVSILTEANDPTLGSTETALFVKGVGVFKTPNVKNIYKAVGYADVLEVATISLTGVTLADLVGKVVRLAVDVTLAGTESGEYSRWAVHKGQPFYVESFISTLPATATALATKLAADFNKGLKRGGLTNLITVESSTSNLVIKAKNAYQRFTSAIVELIPDAFTVAPVRLAAGTVTTAGKEGFGTSWFLTKNIRIPTIERLRFGAEFEDERPLANTIYNQYTIELEVDRDIRSQSAVGDKVTSITNHVFFVPQSLATTFEGSLDDVGTITTVA